MTTYAPVSSPKLGSPNAIPWVCNCRPDHPVVLGMIDSSTTPPTITIKNREHVWVIRGEVATTCKRCKRGAVSTEVGL